jgi:hypothetical protein
MRRWNTFQRQQAFLATYTQVNSAFPKLDSVQQAAFLGADLVINWFFNPVEGFERKRSPKTESQYAHVYALLIPGLAAYSLLGMGRKQEMTHMLNDLSDGLPLCREYIGKIRSAVEDMDHETLRRQRVTKLDDVLWEGFANLTDLPIHDPRQLFNFLIAIRRCGANAVMSAVESRGHSTSCDGVDTDLGVARSEQPDTSISSEGVEDMVREICMIREWYGQLEMEDEEALIFMHRMLDAGQGEWGTILETDGKEYPSVTFRIASYPCITLADPETEDFALLIITMEPNKRRVKTWSLNKPVA